MKITNITRNTLLAENAEIADTLPKRIKGLLGRKELTKNDCLLIKSCNSIHTMFMQFPIDVLFISKNNRVVKILPSFYPWKISPIVLSANFVIEFAAGRITETLTQEGDIIDIDY